MPPSAEEQTETGRTVHVSWGTRHKILVGVLLVLMVVGLAFAASAKFWVPVLVGISDQAPYTPNSDSDAISSMWAPLEATSTDSGYAYENGQIIFVGAVNQSDVLGLAGSLGTTTLPGNPTNFLVSTIDPWFAKDSTQVFYTGTPLTGADPATFEVLGSPTEYTSYAKDKNYAYYEINSSDASESLTPIPNADATSFIDIGYGYAKDAHHVYLAGKIISNADPTTFEVIGAIPADNQCGNVSFYTITKDENNVYLCGDIIQASDPATFTVLMDSNGATSTYAKDEHSVYEIWGDEADSLNGADPNTFVVLDDGYAKDRNKVYGLHGDETLDPQTFSIVPGTYLGEYVRDSKHILYNGECDDGDDTCGEYLDDVDMASFVALNDEYGRDTYHAYFGSDIIPDADVNSFHVFFTPPEKDPQTGIIEWDPLWAFAADKNFVYFGGKVLTGADVATFHLDLPGNYRDAASDKNHTYGEDGSISN